MANTASFGKIPTVGEKKNLLHNTYAPKDVAFL
jgi:hypothetical protein